jgi:hypothetical protein
LPSFASLGFHLPPIASYFPLLWSSHLLVVPGKLVVRWNYPVRPHFLKQELGGGKPMALVLLIALAALFIYALGVLTGSDYTTREQDQRGRRLADKNSALNLWHRELREWAERLAAKEEELRWRDLKQIGRSS